MAQPPPSTSAPAPGQPPQRQRRDLRRFLETYGSLLALALLIALGCWASEDFRKPENFLNVVRQSSFIGIIAVGMTFVIVQGGIDLSVGSMVALLGGVGILAMNAAAEGGQSPAVSVGAAVGVMLVGGGLLGLMNGLIIAKGRVTAFIATLGTMAAYRSIALTTAQGGEYPSEVPLFGRLGAGGLPIPGLQITDGIPLVLHYPVLIFLAVAVAAHILLKRTAYGLYVHAIGDNTLAARYAAVRIDRVRLLTYTLLGLTCGLSALLIAARHEAVSSSQTGALFELDAIAAVVVGGTAMRGGSGRVWSTVVGVLILGFVNNLMNMVITPWLQARLNVEYLDANHLEGLIKGAIIVAAVLLQRGRRDP